MKSIKLTVLAGILAGISGSAFALPNITLLATGELSPVAVIQPLNLTILRAN